jgi:hypothetical protein
MEVFEAHIMAMHKQRWGPAAAAATAGGDGTADQGQRDDGDAGMAGVIETSVYVSDLANAIAVFRWVLQYSVVWHVHIAQTTHEIACTESTLAFLQC